jgi:hypothetical protein
MNSSPCSRVRAWQALDNARLSAHLTIEELWLLYFAYTGVADPLDVDAYLNGLLELPAGEHDILAYAVEERLRLLHRDGLQDC